jgi:hypothetical protein
MPTSSLQTIPRFKHACSNTHTHTHTHSGTKTKKTKATTPCQRCPCHQRCRRANKRCPHAVALSEGRLHASSASWGRFLARTKPSEYAKNSLYGFRKVRGLLGTLLGTRQTLSVIIAKEISSRELCMDSLSVIYSRLNRERNNLQGALHREKRKRAQPSHKDGVHTACGIL